MKDVMHGVILGVDRGTIQPVINVTADPAWGFPVPVPRITLLLDDGAAVLSPWQIHQLIGLLTEGLDHLGDEAKAEVEGWLKAPVFDGAGNRLR